MLTADTPAHLVRGYQEITPGRRALIFCPTVAMTNAVEHAFARAGIRTASVIGSTPVEERQAIYHKVRDGTVRALVNCMVLTEGFDEPSIDAIYMARPTKVRCSTPNALGEACGCGRARTTALLSTRWVPRSAMTCSVWRRYWACSPPKRPA